MDLTPSGRHKRGIKKTRSIKTGKNVKERRNYSKEFKAEAAALAGKKEKPASRIALDLGINGNMPRRRTRQARERQQGYYLHSPDTDGRGTRNLPACGRRMKS
jgi:transposase-like protein